MPKTLYWLQAGGCGGDTMSIMNAEYPNLFKLLRMMDIEVLWHPSLSANSPDELSLIHQEILQDKQKLTVLCVEGAVIQGPNGTGMYDSHRGIPKKNLIRDLAHKADYVVAIGTCASFGGLTGRCEVEACGLQWDKTCFGGFLGKKFRSKADFPVLQLPGCPIHPQTFTEFLWLLFNNKDMELTEYNVPAPLYSVLVHQGCTRNEYHEYRVEERDFCELGCLFFHMGCKGPFTFAHCNKFLWNTRNSKTRAGIPCLGCTLPDFPDSKAFFETECIGDIPLTLPIGINRARYMAYKGMAAAATPKRLTNRETEV